MTESKSRNYSLVLFGGFVACAVVFSVFPQLDLWVSAKFWTPESGFWIADIDWVQLIRKAIMQLMIIVFLASAVAWPLSLIWRPLLGIPARAWAFSTLLFTIGPGLIVNALLKEHWGRARPKKIVEFGGEMRFTAPLDYTDQCTQNCSFVSGEGAGAVALLIAITVLARSMPYQRVADMLILVTWPISAVAICLRVLMGRHFLSDTLFAILIVAAVALILFRLLKVKTR